MKLRLTAATPLIRPLVILVTLVWSQQELSQSILYFKISFNSAIPLIRPDVLDQRGPLKFIYRNA